MTNIILSAATGIVLGAVFRKLKLPIPAPPTIAGVVGILGILLGSMIAKAI